ncbi:DUF1206 domain-containing protein [Croceicoccus bisphenolivorans]|uniref:DUF1206 domain-containing protein n=1 Tax=Croceicoccus bisphenolivorans TaxID=1783232 RepID=UPI00082A4353|nr:DUF1206 domain-containing protein [Croceicoccus bisphenolivorans]
MVDKSEKFNWAVRVGYLSRAILYSVLGLIALTSAGKIAEGTNGIFKAIEDFPAGTVILWIMVVGLLAYALFRFASTFFDIEHNGSDKKGIAKRIGHAGSAIGHIALAWSAYKFATYEAEPSSGGAQEAASGVLSMTLGGVVLGLLGIAFFVAAIMQAKKGISGEFMHRISAQAPQFTRWLGGAGYVARAVVFAIIGWSLFKAGLMSGGADQIKTLGDAVASLSGEGIWFTLVAIGLLMFGLFSLILAQYRIIPDMDVSGMKPAFRA